MPNPSEHEAIGYSTTAPADAIAELQHVLDAGHAELTFDDERGYLPSLLELLDIPVASQGLVFSRTSLQVDRIAPWTPRAIYFNDDVYVAWVQGGPVLEIASADPKLGAVFYTLSQTAPDRGAPRFERQTGTCLMCHDSASVTGGVPGFIVRSVFPDRYGYPIAVADRPTTDRTPLEKRWGGWYVTGTHGEQRHAGNTMAPLLVHEIGNVQSYLARTERSGEGNVTDLTKRFDTKPYLSPHSDIVALLVLAHQVHVHNLLTHAGYEARKALYDEEALLAALGPKAGGGELLAPTRRRIERAAEPLVRAMLFVKEAPLRAPIRGTSGFTEVFQSRGPKDGRGRSLRDLDLETRLFRYPFSFLVYSKSFDALPEPVRRYLAGRVRDVLTGRDESETFSHLSASDRKAIREILEETKPSLTELWN